MVSMLALDVGSHCRFFDRLADYVDPKFYHSQEDREHINPKYMKRDERAAIKRAFKEQHKQNKRAKLDPDAIKTTTELQRQQAEKAASQEQQQQQQAPAAVQQMGKLHLPASGSLSRDDLLKRLHAKMEAARAARNAKDDAASKQQVQQKRQQKQQQKGKQQQQSGSPAAAGDSAKQWRQEQLGKKLKAQQQQQAGQKRKLDEQQQQPNRQQPQQQQPGKGGKQQQQQQQGTGLSFSKLVVEPDRAGSGPKAKRVKPSKQEALEAAQDKQARLADAAARQDKEAIAAEAWRAALSRAAGEKVLDDPKLLRRSIKREAADKARSARKWQERVAGQQEQQQRRQERRKDNLAARSNTKLENKKAKREKKLLRAGFEGRKSGFINAGKK